VSVGEPASSPSRGAETVASSEPIGAASSSGAGQGPPAPPIGSPGRPAPGRGAFGYAPLWTAKDPGGWNHALAIASSGDVLSLSAYDLTVLARHDGSRLDHARVCDDIALRATALEVRGRVVYAVCSDALQDIELPGMRRTERFQLPWNDLESRATAVGFGPRRVAFGNRRGELLEVDLASWRVVAQHQAPIQGEIESLAYTPDGSALAVGVDTEIGKPGQIALLRNGRFERVPNVADSSGAIAFSPSGRELFAEVRSFTAGRVSIVDGRVGNEQHVSSWLTSARYVDEELVAATGAHGVGLFPARGDLAELDDDTGEGLAVSRDGQLLCAGTRDGTIRCWARSRVPPSTYRPIGGGPSAPTPGPVAAGSAAGAAAGAAAPASAAPAEHLGKLVSRTGERVVIELAGPPTPRVGASGELTKRVATDLGGIHITAWLTVARVTVEKVAGTLVTLRIDESLSKINVNGKPVDHLTAGSEVRLDLP
jgi:hypothetical protein